MKKLLAACIALALSAAAPAVSAQFTAVVIPPKKPQTEESPAVAVTAAKAAKDTVLSEKLTDMKAWVDSAAVALAAKPATAIVTDSAPATDSSTITRGAGKPLAEPPAKFRNGAPAPDTATPIPLLLLASAGLIAAGHWIRRR